MTASDQLRFIAAALRDYRQAMLQRKLNPARFCRPALADASILLQTERKPGLAAKRARKSLAYSVGVAHPDYHKVEAICDRLGEEIFPGHYKL